MPAQTAAPTIEPTRASAIAGAMRAFLVCSWKSRSTCEVHVAHNDLPFATAPVPAATVAPHNAHTGAASRAAAGDVPHTLHTPSSPITPLHAPFEHSTRVSATSLAPTSIESLTRDNVSRGRDRTTSGAAAKADWQRWAHPLERKSASQGAPRRSRAHWRARRSEEHTSELQSR